MLVVCSVGGGVHFAQQDNSVHLVLGSRVGADTLMIDVSSASTVPVVVKVSCRPLTAFATWPPPQPEWDAFCLCCHWCEEGAHVMFQL